ncbi:S41 family peptidase [Candidatus Latescibacterota bacterium]
MNKRHFAIILLLLTLFLSGFAITVPSQEITEVVDLLQLQDNILNRIRAAYVDTIKSTELLKGAISGIMGELDPHSSYMPREKATQFNEKLHGTFTGIGITFAMINDKITIIEPIEGGPSQIAGLLSRDKIVKVNGESAIGVQQDSVRNLLRGKKGTTVAVHVERPGEKKLLKFNIHRDRININSVSHAYMIDDRTGYIALSRFTFKSHEDVAAALKKLDSLGMERLVLDLRGNTGGSLEAAVWVVKFFINNGTIVYTKGKRDRDNSRFVASPHKYPVYSNIPMIVMVNHGSASASEIVAGALQDHDRALIVGQTSFGKGLVMHPFPLANDRGEHFGTLMLSVAHYYTPSNRLIQRPYNNGKDEYIKEGFDDIDPNAADSSKAGRPVYYTDLGREVFGGGGITPDRIIDRPRELNVYEKALRGSHVFFEFADDYLLRHDDVPKYFEDFLLNYRLPENELERFRRYALERGISNGDTKELDNDLRQLLSKYEVESASVDSVSLYMESLGISIGKSLFTKSRESIERGIKQEIARMIWGNDARYRVMHTADFELINTLSFFSDAADLLARRLAIGNL